jgi:endonuclease-3
LQELDLLERAYPGAQTELDYESPWTLLIAVILSAQSTDARVNLTTPFLFAQYPTPQALGAAKLADVEELVKSTGFFRVKAKNIVAASRDIAQTYGGEVPRDREKLEALPGVGRKTASVVLSVAFEEPAFAVDTHVYRVSHRLGLTTGKTEREVENDVVKLVPEALLRHAHHWLILHGRRVCKAPRPQCAACVVRDICPSAPIVATFLSARAQEKAAGAKAKKKDTAPKKAVSKKRSGR